MTTLFSHRNNNHYFIACKDFKLKQYVLNPYLYKVIYTNHYFSCSQYLLFSSLLVIDLLIHLSRCLTGRKIIFSVSLATSCGHMLWKYHVATSKTLF